MVGFEVAPGDGVVAHDARELTAAERVAREEVDPDALAVVCELVEPVCSFALA